LLHFLAKRLKKDVCRLKKNISSLTSWIIFFYLSTSVVVDLKSLISQNRLSLRLYAIQHPADSQRYPRLSCFISRKASAATKPISLANSLAKFQSCSLSIASAPRISRERAVELSALKWLNFIKRYFSNYLRRGRRELPPCSCNHVYGVCWGRVSKL